MHTRQRKPQQRTDPEPARPEQRRQAPRQHALDDATPVQRRATASPAPTAAAPKRSSWGWTSDPMMDAAHRGTPLPDAGTQVQRSESQTATTGGEATAAPAATAEETPAAATAALLTDAQVTSAISFYKPSFWPGPKIANACAELGIAPRQQIDAGFVQAAASFQQQNSLTVDGKIGSGTLMVLFGGDEMNRAHTVADRMTGQSESGGDYGAIQTKDSGIISYGVHQSTLASGNLGKLLEDYLNRAASSEEASPHAGVIQGYMARIRDRAQHEGLRSEQPLISALRAAGQELAMQQAQDAFFTDEFWAPAVKAALAHGITSQLGFVTVYDTHIQGGMESVLKSTRDNLGGIVGATVKRANGSVQITEQAFLVAFNQAREGRLERIANSKEAKGDSKTAGMLRTSKVRPRAFGELAQAGNLDLSSNVEGKNQLEYLTYGNRRTRIDLPAASGEQRAPAAAGPTAPTAPTTTSPTKTAPEADTTPAPAPAAPETAAPAPAGPETAAPSEDAVQSYQVRAGDTLGAIAARLLGDLQRWREIAEANGITNPRALKVGQTLRIPALTPATTTAGPSAEVEATSEPAPAPEAPAPEAVAPASVDYQVRSGDTLAVIARRLLGDAQRWREIAEANDITNPRALRVGQVLAIPGGNAQAAARAQAAPQAAPAAKDDAPAARTEAEAESEQGGGAQASGGTGATPSWITVAEGELGTAEIAGARHNPRVIEYHATTGGFSDDETPWCASFVNWVLQRSGQGGTGSAAAMSFQNYGTQLDRPAYGCIAVFSYGGGKGHVGFVVGKQGDRLLVLGGNQGDQVKVSSYGTGSIVAYVVPSGYDVPAAAYSLGGATGEVADGGGLAQTR